MQAKVNPALQLKYSGGAILDPSLFRVTGIEKDVLPESAKGSKQGSNWQFALVKGPAQHASERAWT